MVELIEFKERNVNLLQSYFWKHVSKKFKQLRTKVKESGYVKIL